MAKKGKYIVIEGSDGSGKGTQIERAEVYLESITGRKPIRTMEPGGTPLGDMMRLAIKDGSINRHPKSNVDMLTVSRREGADQVIRPAVSRGRIVTADRSWFSTLAYQGFGEGVDLRYIEERSRDALGDLFIPDLAVVLRVPFEIIEERMKGRGGSEADFFESKQPEFFRRVIAGYDYICEHYGAMSIDGTGSEAEVHQDIADLLNNQVKGDTNGI